MSVVVVRQGVLAQDRSGTPVLQRWNAPDLEPDRLDA